LHAGIFTFSLKNFYKFIGDVTDVTT